MTPNTSSSTDDRPAAAETEVKPVAVIDVGTSSIRMAIAEIDASGRVRILERLAQAVNLGKDTFTRGAISKSTIEDCVRVLRSYRQLLNEYQITQEDRIRIVATSAVREAENRLSFLDRIYVATGMQVEPIDEAEVNRITYLGTQPLLQAQTNLARGTSVVVEVGGGSTELLVVQDEAVIFSHTYRLGSLRLWEPLEAFRTPRGKVRKIMQTQIERIVDQIVQNIPQAESLEMIALGGDVRFAASQLLSDWHPDGLARLPIGELEKFTDRMLELSQDQIVRKYHLTYPDAETLGPALLAYVQLAKGARLQHILVTKFTLRDGLLQEMAVKGIWTEHFQDQVMRSAIDLGRKYEFDEPHAVHVAELSRQLFNALQDDHRLEPRYRLILAVAAVLHEIGQFVSSRAYHKHSMYLISSSELFGLSQRDLRLAAQVARYHRRASPKPTHTGYATLEREQRIAVAKMAAMLRVADALDRSHSQRVHKIECLHDTGRLIIGVPGVEDLSLEQLALNQKGPLFEEIFGMQVLLRQIQSNRG